jgi:predicted ATP-dependent endonuclease of OLD family
MHIDELHIQNFRCFKEIKIYFPQDNLAILIGINASGKSAILNCIAALLIQLETRIIEIEITNFFELENVCEKINKTFAIRLGSVY